MNNDTIRHIELETHQTKDISDGHVNGSLTVIWRDWDKILEVAKNGLSFIRESWRN